MAEPPFFIEGTMGLKKIEKSKGRKKLTTFILGDDAIQIDELTHKAEEDMEAELATHVEKPKADKARKDLAEGIRELQDYKRRKAQGKERRYW